MTRFIPLDTEQFQLPAPGPSVEEIVETRLRVAALHRLIARLPFDERAIIENELSRAASTNEMAQRLGLTVSQVAHRKSRAVQRMNAAARMHEYRFVYAEAA
jgi:DNA-directed RNA polymerase specialized sigma24 family protein